MSKLNITGKKKKNTFSVTLNDDSSKELIAFTTYFGYQSLSDYIRTAIRELNFKHRVEYRQQFIFDRQNPDKSLQKLFMDQQEQLDELTDIIKDVVEKNDDELKSTQPTVRAIDPPNSPFPVIDEDEPDDEDDEDDDYDEKEEDDEDWEDKADQDY